jgi:hypothetical protein
MYKVGSNQFVAHKKFQLKVAVQRDVWFLTALTLFVIFVGREWSIKHPAVSPCPKTGCFVSEVEAAEIQAKYELRKIREEETRPTKTNVISYIAKTFESEGAAVQVRAIRCFYSESGLRTEAYNFNSNGTEDRGVAQINSVHGMKPEDAHDYRKNIEKAYEIYKQAGKTFRPWFGKDCGN